MHTSGGTPDQHPCVGGGGNNFQYIGRQTGIVANPGRGQLKRVSQARFGCLVSRQSAHTPNPAHKIWYYYE